MKKIFLKPWLFFRLLISQAKRKSSRRSPAARRPNLRSQRLVNVRRIPTRTRIHRKSRFVLKPRQHSQGHVYASLKSVVSEALPKEVSELLKKYEQLSDRHKALFQALIRGDLEVSVFHFLNANVETVITSWVSGR